MLILICALLLIFPNSLSSFAGANSDVIYSGWTDLSNQHPDSTNFYGAWWTDSSVLGNQNPSGLSMPCQTLDNCQTPYTWQAMLPFCDSKSAMNCIADVWAVDSSGKRISYSNHRYFPEDQAKVYQGNTAFHIPSGSTGSVVEFPGLSNGGGTTDYAITVMGHGGIDSLNSDGSFSATDPLFIASINPIKVVPGNYSPMSMKDPSGRQGYWVPPEDSNCAVVKAGFCGIPVDFPPNVSFGLSLRLNQNFYGWIHGRLSAATFDSTNLGGGAYLLTVIGEPSAVPDVTASVATKDVKADSLFTYGYKTSPGQWDLFAPYREKIAYPAFLSWLPYMSGKASNMEKVWAFRNLKKYDISSTADQTSLSCLAKYSLSGDNPGIVGLLNTNAVTYLPTPPVFNSNDQTLEYGVASAHFSTDGSVISGMYSLQLRSDVARCIFGLSTMPIKATISVISTDGTQTTTTSNLIDTGNFLTFRVDGFHYSGETIKIHLENDSSLTSTPSSNVATTSLPMTPAAPNVAHTSISKVTIHCVKGKVTKSVSGINPKCPVGYKKK